MGIWKGYLLPDQQGGIGSLMHVVFSRVIAINYWRIHSIVHRLLKNSISTSSKIIKNKTNYSMLSSLEPIYRGSNILITLAIMVFLFFFSPFFLKEGIILFLVTTTSGKRGRGIEPTTPKARALGFTIMDLLSQSFVGQ